MSADSHLSIWFFVGVLLVFYGVVIAGAGLYGFRSPPHVQLAEYHADLWWGLLLLAIGAFYCHHFAPHRRKPAPRDEV